MNNKWGLGCRWKAVFAVIIRALNIADPQPMRGRPFDFMLVLRAGSEKYIEANTTPCRSQDGGQWVGAWRGGTTIAKRCTDCPASTVWHSLLAICPRDYSSVSVWY